MKQIYFKVNSIWKNSAHLLSSCILCIFQKYSAIIVETFPFVWTSAIWKVQNIWYILNFFIQNFIRFTISVHFSFFHDVAFKNLGSWVLPGFILLSQSYWLWILGKLLDFSVPQCLCIWNGYNNSNLPHAIVLMNGLLDTYKILQGIPGKLAIIATIIYWIKNFNFEWKI